MRGRIRILLALILVGLLAMNAGASETAHEHTPEVIPGYPADCLHEGMTEGSRCSVCGEILVEPQVIPHLEHDPIPLPGKSATCRENGLTEGTMCQLCGTVLIPQHLIPAFDCPSARFTDVGESAWYHDAVDYMVLHGLMSGTGGSKFEPTKNLTRAELVQVFYNMSGVSWASVHTEFSDVAESAWYARAVSWASANHIVSGTGKYTFSPQSFASREMVFTILYRYAAGVPLGENYLTGFRDGSAVSGWAVDAVNWAVGKGYVRGSNNCLNPGNRITRAELAQLMTNYLRSREE